MEAASCSAHAGRAGGAGHTWAAALAGLLGASWRPAEAVHPQMTTLLQGALAVGRELRAFMRLLRQ